MNSEFAALAAIKTISLIAHETIMPAEDRLRIIREQADRILKLYENK